MNSRCQKRLTALILALLLVTVINLSLDLSYLREFVLSRPPRVDHSILLDAPPSEYGTRQKTGSTHTNPAATSIRSNEESAKQTEDGNDHQNVIPQSAIDEPGALVNKEKLRETGGHDETKIDVESIVKEDAEEAGDPTDWLLNNPNIIVRTSITDDVLPPYFNTSAPDNMAAQYEKYHNLTRAIMEKRLDRIKEQCLVKSVYLKRSQYFYYYFPEMGPEGATWCPTFKAASTNWKQFFCKAYKPDIYQAHLNNTQEPYCHIDALGGYRIQGTKDKIAWKIGAKKSIKFATARHPYERLVSVYNNKFKECATDMFTDGRMMNILRQFRKVTVPLQQKERYLNKANEQCHRPIAKRILDPNNPYMTPLGITFREFIESLVSELLNGKGPDFHWITTAKGCDFCNAMDYDVVEKFETLERDHYYLLKILGQEARYPDIEGLHTNPSGNSKQQLQSYFATLNERLLWSLRAIYRDDLDLFGYLPHYQVKKNPYS